MNTLLKKKISLKTTLNIKLQNMYSLNECLIPFKYRYNPIFMT